MTCIEYINWIINNPDNYHFIVSFVDTSVVHYHITRTDPNTGRTYIVVNFYKKDGKIYDNVTKLELGSAQDVKLDKFEIMAVL